MRAGNEWLSGKNVVIPTAAGAVIREGCMVAVNADGYAVEAEKASDLKVIGCAQRHTDNHAGTAGEQNAFVRRGTFLWYNAGTIEQTDLFKDCYVSDAQTVTLTADGSFKAGIIIGLEDDCVIVEV